MYPPEDNYYFYQNSLKLILLKKNVVIRSNKRDPLKVSQGKVNQ